MELIWVFTLAMIPLGIVCGLATSVIAFTAWAIVTPLLFVGFGLPIFESICISLFLDATNSIFTVWAYRTKGVKFNHKYTWISVPSVIAGATGGIFFSRTFLPQLAFLLKGGLPYMPLIIGCSFLVRSVRQYRASKAEKKTSSEMNESVDMYESMDSNDGNIQTEDGFTSVPIGETKKRKTLTDLATENIDQVKPRFYKDKPIVCWSLLLCFNACTAFIGSFLGFGGGMMFCVYLVLFFDFKLIDGIVFGCFQMTVLGFTACILDFILGLARPGFVWSYFLAETAFGLVGVLLGYKFASKLEMWALSFVTMVVLFACGIIMVVLPLLV